MQYVQTMLNIGTMIWHTVQYVSPLALQSNSILTYKVSVIWINHYIIVTVMMFFCNFQYCDKLFIYSICAVINMPPIPQLSNSNKPPPKIRTVIILRLRLPELFIIVFEIYLIKCALGTVYCCNIILFVCKSYPFLLVASLLIISNKGYQDTIVRKLGNVKQNADIDG